MASSAWIAPTACWAAARSDLVLASMRASSTAAQSLSRFRVHGAVSDVGPLFGVATPLPTSREGARG
jgi:hypothetical protein